MPEISWSMIFSAAKAGHSIIDEQKRSELIRKFKWLITKRKRIIVFGLSGAGKSQFINSLKQTLSIPARTLTSDKIKHDIGEFPILFIDTPGHSERSVDRQKEIRNIIKNEAEGIINVVSYGYDENPGKRLNVIFDSSGKVNESFLTQNRKTEIDRLNEWLPIITPNDVDWVINLVNKADIWWEQQDIVNEHYIANEYSKTFESFRKYSNVVTLPYCSLIKPYYDVVQPSVFGELEKKYLHAHFVHQLLNLLREE